VQTLSSNILMTLELFYKYGTCPISVFETNAPQMFTSNFNLGKQFQNDFGFLLFLYTYKQYFVD
jgi:hypothetical protein